MAWESGRALEHSQNGPSRYAPNIDENVREALETHCIDEGIPVFEDADIGKFVIDVGTIIGVCSGEYASFVFAEWSGPPNGEIHGRPVSRRRLRDWGFQV